VFSLCIWLAIIPVSFLLTTWAITRAARAVGSPRGRLRDGFAVCVVATVINVSVGLLAGTIMPKGKPDSIVAAGGLLLGQLVIV
jgi:hypothetical protein